jgi:glycosyltransferase involved in cell wall biosynthesis
MEILILPRYSRLGASSRLRIYQYIPYLESAGIHCIVHPFFDDLYVNSLLTKHKPLFNIIKSYLKRVYFLFKYKNIDIIWIEKEVFPWVPYWIEQIAVFNKKKTIVDYDDAVFYQYTQHSSRVVRILLGEKIDKIIESAFIVVVGNEYLKKYAVTADSNRVKVVPTVVNIDNYKTTYKNVTIVTIGWIGSPATTKYLCSIAPIFSYFQNSNIKFIAVGAKKELLVGLPIEVILWNEEQEAYNIQQFDIGIMPLTNELFAQGKCGYKLIQYMACGKPVIASPVGVNCSIVKHGINGFLASTVDEWKEAIISLVDDPYLRLNMGTKGRKLVEQEYSLDITVPLLKTLILSVTGRS